jgi:3',5'-cyclic AMP phosphodiesterase CpdA
MSLFDVYVPTCTPDSVEVRVRTTADGPVTLTLDDRQTFLPHPNLTFGGARFFRHTFDELPADTRFSVNAALHSGKKSVEVLADTLKAPDGAEKLKVGVLSDLHLPRHALSIEAYRPGTRRLIGLSEQLARRYIRRLEAMGADIIVLPGDLVEPCTTEMLSKLKEIIHSVSIPCLPIIGNHEPWSRNGEVLFYEVLDLPPGGYYAVERNRMRLLMLSTPDPAALAHGSRQLAWLKEQLDEAAPNDDIVLFSHFSLRLHPCVAGSRNDGYQLLSNHREILNLIEQYPNVRVFAAGHKNVPSVMVRNGIVHTLSPQLIQSPCGYDLFHFFEGGVQRTTFEIEEQHYCELARAAYAHDWPMRFGSARSRNFHLSYTP